MRDPRSINSINGYVFVTLSSVGVLFSFSPTVNCCIFGVLVSGSLLIIAILLLEVSTREASFTAAQLVH